MKIFFFLTALFVITIAGCAKKQEANISQGLIGKWASADGNYTITFISEEGNHGVFNLTGPIKSSGGDGAIISKSRDYGFSISGDTISFQWLISSAVYNPEKVYFKLNNNEFQIGDFWNYSNNHITFKKVQ